MRFLKTVEIEKETLQKRWEELGCVGQDILLAILFQKEMIPGVSEYLQKLSPYMPFVIPMKSVFAGLFCVWALVHGTFAAVRYITEKVDAREDAYFIYGVLGVSVFLVGYILPKIVAVFFS